MCEVLEVSRSGYYAWLRRDLCCRLRRDEHLLGLIRNIHRESRGIYGAPRIHAELKLGLNEPCSRKRVARLMRLAGIVGIHRRKFRGCTRRDPRQQPQADLVQRQFTRSEPNQLWVADLTEHKTAEGRLYLATVLDVCSRRVVGFATGTTAEARLPIRALDMALLHRRPDRPLIHHSDHGCQYGSLAFTKRLRAAGLQASMGTVGDALDNASAESFFATLQTELLDRQTWSSRIHLSRAIFDYIEAFYNRIRRHSSLGYLSPVEFERKLAAGQPTTAHPSSRIAAT
jgi:putative transposase